MKTSESIVHVAQLVHHQQLREGFQITCYDHPSQPGLQAGRE